MNIKEIYNLAIKRGIETDLRGEELIRQIQDRLNKKYQSLSDKEKERFDTERLNNPFSDSRILFEGEDKPIKKVLAGIDIGGEELLLAKELADIDLIIAHHPSGKALAGLDDVMQLQIDLLNFHGVPVNIAEKLMAKRISEVSRSLSPANHNRTVDMAKLLGAALICLHTPCDNLAAKFVGDLVKEKEPVFVEDVMDLLNTIPEYQKAVVGPKIFLGSPDNRAGKVIIDMTGGTEGAPEIYERLAQAGVGTVIGMHISEKHREEAEKANINVVIAGHISSDSIGMNLFLDELEKEGIEIVPCSGLIRVSRL